jgi:hypothetical protein
VSPKWTGGIQELAAVLFVVVLAFRLFSQPNGADAPQKGGGQG